MIELNGQKYEIIKNEKEGLDINTLKEKITDYFLVYDYIVGDWAYGKLRLKGFNDKTNKHHNRINSYEKVNEYLEKDCAYGCKYFIIKKIK